MFLNYTPSVGLIVAALIPGFQSLSTGSPFCSLNTNAISRAHGPSSNTGFALTVKPSQTGYEISVTDGAVGLLLFAQGPDSKQHVGSFANPPTGFKFIDSICQAEGITSNQGTVSHSNGNSKGAATFLWKPGQAPVVNVTIQAILTGRKNPWQSTCIKLDNSPCTTSPASRLGDAEVGILGTGDQGGYEDAAGDEGRGRDRKGYRGSRRRGRGAKGTRKGSKIQ